MENSSYITKLLSTDSYLVLNKELIKKLGLIPASLLCELCSEYNYYEKVNKLEYGIYFYSTQKNITENIGISRHQQDSAIEILEKLNLLQEKRMGMPSKRYFKLNFDKIEEFLKKNANFNENTINSQEIDKNTEKTTKNQDCQKLTIKIDPLKNNEKSRLSKIDNQDCEKLTNKIVENSQTSLLKIDKQDCQKLTTKSNNNNNKNSNNNYLILSEQKDEMEYYRFVQNINLKDLYKSYQSLNNKKSILTNVLEIIKDVYLSNQKFYIINGNKILKSNYVAQLEKYDFDTMQYLIDSLCNNQTEIKNIKAYMLSSIYNAPQTIDLYYYNQMKNDMLKSS